LSDWATHTVRGEFPKFARDALFTGEMIYR